MTTVHKNAPVTDSGAGQQPVGTSYVLVAKDSYAFSGHSSRPPPAVARRRVDRSGHVGVARVRRRWPDL